MSARLTAIDPGYAKAGSGCACAAFDGAHQLHTTAYLRPHHRPPPRLFAEIVVVEQPQVDGRTWSATPATVRLAWEGALVAGRLAGASGGRVVSLTPDDWKGTIAKPVHHGRAWAVLSDREQWVLRDVASEAAIEESKCRGARDRWAKEGAVYCRGYDHNRLDAVALGLFALGRLPRYDAGGHETWLNVTEEI
jgi:hypothetical protein